MNIILLLLLSYFPMGVTGQSGYPVVDFNGFYGQHYGHYDSYGQWDGFNNSFGDLEHTGIPLVVNWFNEKINYTYLIDNFDFNVNSQIIPKPYSQYTVISTYHNKNFIYLNVPAQLGNYKVIFSQN